MQASSSQNQITIQRNGYTGYLKITDYSTNSSLVESFGGNSDVSAVIAKVPTRLAVETGANLGDSAIEFNVKADGTIDVTSIVPQEAVHLEMSVSRTLVLNTKPVTIDPGNYTGYYYLSAIRDTANPAHPVMKLKGPHPPFNLVAGLVFAIDNGTHYYIIDTGFSEPESCDPKKGFTISSDFTFKVLATGSLQTNNTIASKVTNTVLHFKTTSVIIDPMQISEGSPITCQESTITTKKEFFFLPSLTTRLYWQASGCRKNQFFVPM